MFLSVLGIIACSDSNHKAENNAAVGKVQDAIQNKTEPALLTEDQTELKEKLQETGLKDTSSRQIISHPAKDSLIFKLEADTIRKKISIEEKKIATSRKKILNFQEEIKFYESQQSKLNADESMRDAVDRINQNVETVQGYIENEEENINLAKTNISKLEKKIENLKISSSQSSTTISKEIIEKTDIKLDQQSTGPIDKQALEKELNDLKKLNKGVNARILYYEHMLDSLNAIGQEPENEQTVAVIVLEDKETREKLDQNAANQLQDLADKTINKKKKLSAEQIKAAKERNSSGPNAQGSSGFAKFIGFFFLIILVLTGSLYFIGKSFQGKKKNK